jgi:hypothetical protein
MTTVQAQIAEAYTIVPKATIERSHSDINAHFNDVSIGNDRASNPWDWDTSYISA